MLDALVAEKVDIVMMDTFNLATLKEELTEKKLKVAEMIDTNSGYGMVLGGISKSLKDDISSALLVKEHEVTHFVEEMKENLPVSL